MLEEGPFVEYDDAVTNKWHCRSYGRGPPAVAMTDRGQK